MSRVTTEAIDRYFNLSSQYTNADTVALTSHISQAVSVARAEGLYAI